MSSQRHAMENRQILEEASTWFVEFRLGNPDDARRKDFMRWLKRSPEHIRAYMEISSVYAQLPGATSIPRAEAQRLIERVSARSTVVAFDPLEELDIGSVRAAARGEGRPSTRSAARLAASIAFLCVAGGLATWLFLDRPPTYATQTAEQSFITLDDGSRMELNALTKVRVAFGPNERRVELVEGQALFQVAPDPARPFIVSGAGTQERAVGTRFDVNLKRSGTVVTVLEGKVAVKTGRHARVASGSQPGLSRKLAASSSDASPPDQEAASTLLLVAGEQAIITPTSVAKPKLANVAAAVAWQEGELEFEETPLSEVAEEFNRHSRVRLVIDSQALDDFRITGIYSASDPRPLIRFLYNQPDLVVTETRSEIHISRR